MIRAALAGLALAVTPAGLFSYDASQPLRLRDAGRVNARYPIAVRDVSYASRGGRVDAYLALPPGKARLPAVIYLHGSGGDRGQLLVPATWAAARGAVALTITAPSATAHPPAGATGLAGLRWQREVVARDVVAVRRAIDLLGALPRVDPQRIGLVGWSGGARMGAIVAGVEPRLRAVVLMSGGATPVAAYAAQAPADVRGAVARILGEIDPLRWIRRARPEALLLQDGRSDAVVPRSALEALARAAPSGTAVRWYPAGHALDDDAYRDQLSWLSRRLGIHGPTVRGARAGP